MSLLHQESEKLDDTASRGEDYAKGSSYVIWAILAATFVVSAAIGLYFWVGEKPPAATGEVEQVWAHPMHTETSGLDASGAPMPKESFDQILVFAKVKLHNQGKEPLFLHQIMTDTTLDDGVHTSYAAGPSDFDRVFVAYPELSPLHGKAMPAEASINPGQTLEGTFVSAFRLSKQQWDARKSLDFTFAFQYQPNLKLVPQGAVIEQ
jgi:hypothetical protein